MELKVLKSKSIGQVLLVPVAVVNIGFTLGNNLCSPELRFYFMKKELYAVQILLSESLSRGRRPAVSLEQKEDKYQFILTIGFVDHDGLEFLRPYELEKQFVEIQGFIDADQINVFGLAYATVSNKDSLVIKPSRFLEVLDKYESFNLCLMDAETMDQNHAWRVNGIKLLSNIAGEVRFRNCLLGRV